MSIYTLQNQLVRVCLPWRLGKTGMMSRCLRRCPVSPLIGPHFVQEMPKIFSLTHRNSSLRKPGLFLQWLFYGRNTPINSRPSVPKFSFQAFSHSPPPLGTQTTPHNYQGTFGHRPLSEASFCPGLVLLKINSHFCSLLSSCILTK